MYTLFKMMIKFDGAGKYQDSFGANCMQLPCSFTGPLKSKQLPQGLSFVAGRKSLQFRHERSEIEATDSYPKLSRTVRSASVKPDRSLQSVSFGDVSF